MDTTQTFVETGRIFRVIDFTAQQTHYIDYNAIAKQAREIGGAFTVHYNNEGAATVTLYWEA
jgi:spore cortex formation protein SpoVR/YcgB (stage V sporulation)